MSNLPDELGDEQRNKVKDLLIRHRSIISTGEHDIGRTHFVEHPFQHLDWIDNEVTKMQEHGIVEPAASPWAPSVVLVKKKDGALTTENSILSLTRAVILCL